MTSDPLSVLTNAERAYTQKAGHPRWLAPMLATLTDRRFSNPDWIFERKLDGERLLAFRNGDELRLLTRNRKRIENTYPEVADALGAQDCRDFVVDGEVVAFDGNVTSFSRLQSRMQIKDPEQARKSATRVWFYAFDIIHCAGRRLDALQLRARKKVLKRALQFEGVLRYCPHRNACGEAYFEEACRKGWEGVIAKDARSSYSHSRSRDWLKFKCAKGQELVIGGFTEPRGERIGFGALLVGYFQDQKLCYAGKVGTGYDDEFLQRFHQQLEKIERKDSPFAKYTGSSKGVTWVEPKFVGEFGFTEWTRAGKLRHPRFLGLRDDKPAEDVVREKPISGKRRRNSGDD